MKWEDIRILKKKTTIEITFISDGKEHRKFIELTIWT